MMEHYLETAERRLHEFVDVLFGPEEPASPDVAPIYDRTGRVVAWLDQWKIQDRRPIYDLCGMAVAHVDRDLVYSLVDGRHIGWLDLGHIRDRSGVVGFLSSSEGGPVKPARQAAPERPDRCLIPAWPIPTPGKDSPVFESTWSDQSWNDFIGHC